MDYFNVLPLPLSGKITRIIHISDLHIHFDQTRYIEYSSVFQRLIDYYYNCDITSTVTIICGDSFQTKNKYSPISIELFTNLIQSISKITPVYIILGNHDYRQDKLELLDSISPLLKLNNNKNVLFMNKRGYYYSSNSPNSKEECDVGFAMVPIQQTLDNGNISESCDDMPQFPPASGFPDFIKTKIAMFHGAVPQRIPLSWFGDGYDYIALGDIHIQSVDGGITTRIGDYCDNNNINNNVCHVAHHTKINNEPLWGYPSSLIQQNHGETIYEHGFIKWDLENQCADTYHVKNDYGLVSVFKHENEWIGKIGSNRYFKLEECKKYKWFPSTLRIRYKQNVSVFQDQGEIVDILKNIGIKIESIKNSQTINYNDNDNNDYYNNNNNEMDGFDNINSTEALVEYITNINTNINTNTDTNTNIEKIPYKDWVKWFTDPHELLIKCDDFKFDSVLKSRIDEKNKKLNTEVENYINTNININKQSAKSFKMLKLEWANILCFGDDNYFDFEKLKSNVVCINSKNGSGKTSFLETISISIFGEGFPSRSNKDYTASIICQQKASTSEAYTKITFELNGDVYCIRRKFLKLKNGKICSKNSVLSRKDCKNEGTFVEMYKGKTAIAEWVVENIGSVNSFLMSCMITQDFDINFFDMSPQDQKARIDNALSLQSISAFKSLVHEFSNAYKSLYKELELLHQVNLDSHYYNNNNKDFDSIILDSKKTINNTEIQIITLKKSIEEKRKDLTSKTTYSIMALGYNGITTKIQELTTLIDVLNGLLSLEDGNVYNVCNVYNVSLEGLIEKRGGLQFAFDKVKEYYYDNYNINNNKIIKLPSFSLDVVENELKKHNLYNVNNTTNTVNTTNVTDDINVTDVIDIDIDKVKQDLSDLLVEREAHMQSKPYYDDINNNNNKINYSQEEEDELRKQYETIKDVYIQKPDASLDDAIKSFNEWIYKVEEYCGSNPSLSEFEIMYDICVEACLENKKYLYEVNLDYFKTEKELNDLIQRKCVLNDQYLTHVDNTPVFKYTKEDYSNVNFGNININNNNTNINNIKNIKNIKNIETVKRFENDQNKLKDLLEKLEKTEDQKSKQSNYAFNPSCKACMNHPWRLTVENIDKEIVELEDDITNVERFMISYEDYQETLIKIRNYDINIEKEWVDKDHAFKVELIALDRNIKKNKKKLEMLEFNKIEHQEYLTVNNNKLARFDKYKKQYHDTFLELKLFIEKGKKDLSTWETFTIIKDEYDDLVNFTNRKLYENWVIDLDKLNATISTTESIIKNYETNKQVIELIRDRDIWLQHYKENA